MSVDLAEARVLAEALRSEVCRSERCRTCVPRLRAADALSALADENERLRCGHAGEECDWPDIPCAFFDRAEEAGRLEEEHERLRKVLAYEARVAEAHYEGLKSYPKSRLRHAIEQVERLRALARGGWPGVYDREWPSVELQAESVALNGPQET